jgi:hypothetical protein
VHMGVLSVRGPSPLGVLLGRTADKRNLERLMAPAAAAAAAPGGAGAAGATYAANLAKLIPGEALSLYAAGGSVHVPPEMANVHVWPAFCLAAAIIFRWLATRTPGSNWPQWSALFIAIVSFILWIYGQNDWFFAWKISPNYSHYVAYAMLFWVFVLPAVVGDWTRPNDAQPPAARGAAS